MVVVVVVVLVLQPVSMRNAYETPVNLLGVVVVAVVIVATEVSCEPHTNNRRKPFVETKVHTGGGCGT